MGGWGYMFVIMWGWCKIEGIDRTTTTSSRSSITTTTTTTRSSFLSPTWRQRSIGHGGKAAWTNGLWPRQGLRAWRRQAVPLLQFPRCPLPSFLQLCLLLLLLLLLVFLRLLRLLLKEAEAQLAEAWRDLTQAQHRAVAAGAQRKCHVAARHSTSGCAKCLSLS